MTPASAYALGVICGACAIGSALVMLAHWWRG